MLPIAPHASVAIVSTTTPSTGHNKEEGDNFLKSRFKNSNPSHDLLKLPHCDPTLINVVDIGVGNKVGRCRDVPTEPAPVAGRGRALAVPNLDAGIVHRRIGKIRTFYGRRWNSMVVFLVVATLLMMDVVEAVFTPADGTALKAAVGTCVTKGSMGSECTGGCLGENSAGNCLNYIHGAMAVWDVSKVTNMERSTSTSTCSWMVSRLILLIDLFLLFLSFKWFFFSIGHIVTIILSVRVWWLAVFQNAEEFNADISKWDTGKVTNMANSRSTSFMMASRLILWINLFLFFQKSFCLSDRLMGTVFAHHQTGTSHSTAFNGNVSMWDTGKVTNMANSTSTSVPHLFMNGVSIDFAN